MVAIVDNYTAKASQRLWAKTAITDDPDKCWEWQATISGGYGMIRFRGKMIGAHRLAYIIAHGDIPNGIDVMHSCDNPICVNPKHLSLGTVTDNMIDMVQKGRGNYGSGETSRTHKLNDEKVNYIRQRYAAGGITLKELGNETGVTYGAVWYIVHGITWKEA